MGNEGGAGASEILIQLLPSILISILLVVRFVRILRRAGRSAWWVLILFLPAVGWLILPWVVAFMRWEMPREDLQQVFS